MCEKEREGKIKPLLSQDDNIKVSQYA